MGYPYPLWGPTLGLRVRALGVCGLGFEARGSGVTVRLQGLEFRI